jgi:flagellar basal body rod protein FlgC
VSVSGVGGRVASPGLSGLRDAMLRVDVAAGNIANLQAQNVSPARVVSSELPRGGVESVVIRDDTGQGVDLITEIVSMMMARLAFSANLAALAQTLDAETSLLNIVR